MSAVLPSSREEAWRYTPVRKVQARIDELTGTEVGSAGGSNPQHVMGLLEGGLTDVAAHVVIVDGKLSDELSTLQTDGSGGVSVRAGNAIVGTVVKAASHPEAAWNAREASEVVSIDISAVVERPVLVSVVATQPAVHQVRFRVAVTQSAQAALVTRFVGADGVASLTNVVTEVTTAANAHLRHISLQEEGDEAHHLHTLGAHLDRDSSLYSYVLSLGSAISRTAVLASMRGPGAHAQMDGLYVGNGSQSQDHYTVIQHAAPHCTSGELYKGVLDDRATGSFQGRILMAEGAVKSASEQMNRNLVLSERAKVNTKPQMEIDNDDVKAAHGATVGQLDPMALFYLQARGIDAGTARRLLIEAFAQEIIERLPVDGLKDRLRDVVAGRLAQRLAAEG